MTFYGKGPYAKPAVTPTQIKNIIMMGDSLSDRGTLNKTLLFGCIPMSLIGGLKGKSPEGRFTNGLVWSDHVSAKIASDFTIKRLQKKWHLDDTDVSDAVISHDNKIMSAIRDNYSLDDDNFVNYYGRLWVRSYCIGGLTSHDYSWSLSTSIIRFFRRLIVSTLDDICKKLLEYDIENQLSYKHKAETLVIEWSGANDLLTVNAKPSLEEVDKAIAARFANIKKLIASGYQQFIVVNLPNLALTPRFQALSQREQDESKKCTDYFNSELQKAADQLNMDYPHCAVDVFNVNTMFERVYKNPTPYLFDKEKLTTPYTKSKDFKKPVNGLSQATGYMFYDDIHPSADLHALLASYFYDTLPLKYELLEPDQECHKRKSDLTEQELLQCYRMHYEKQLLSDQNGFFKSKKSNIDYKNADLKTVIRHAFYEDGPRTLSIINKLGWFDKKGQLILDEPVLKKAADEVQQKESTNGFAQLRT